MKNNQYGFSLIELLIVLLIVGVLLSAVSISVNSLSGKQQVKTLTQLKNQIKAAKHDAQFFNFEMRVVYNDLDKFKNIAKEISDFLKTDLGKRKSYNIGEKQTLQISAQVFNANSGEWEDSKNIRKVKVKENQVQFIEPYIYIRPNGFITDTSGICVETDCIKTDEK